MAAGVAHEIRNPLAVISGFIQMMEKDRQGANHREIMLQELNRINLIISEFLVFSKPQSPQFETEDLKKIVSEVVTLLQPEALLKDAMINFLESKQDIFVECEKNQIKQVLINLIKNAIEAMPTGGNVMVELLVVDGSKIRMKVTDEGLGIPEEQITKLGEPFFTTKDTGTGLGLMVSQKIIENHQGKIKFLSKVGNGTTVEVDLPQKK
ncbi:hypothetical protein H1D32_21535 [Anaerobacillus sp. CMMVII]|uniref:ATP-binding protein n=1 Tax=Anaerobacillus sp. CMMVII TaxID=2755588 RepID=UPI0021B74DF5|nr:ATP-binding protein [Anaerobacillus sp. CMMVII]MCT8140042.1 hypothetical protein [Anaerobacillus sp. CMMVII]